VPTLIIHGDDDQIVPIKTGGARSAKMIEGATFKVYPGAPHGLMSTHQKELNGDLLEFAQQQSPARVAARREVAPPRREQARPDAMRAHDPRK
jgi:non-heme chloroperoxidase